LKIKAFHPKKLAITKSVKKRRIFKPISTKIVSSRNKYLNVVQNSLMLELLEKIGQILEALQIPYMLSGSVAMNFYTDPRTTRDIDIIVELQNKDVPAFVAQLGNQFYVYPEGIYEEIARQGMFNVIDFKTGFILRNDEAHEQLKFKNRLKIHYLGVDLWIIRLEDLVISKLKWIQVLESEKQKSDIINLLDVFYIDMQYIKDWCHRLNLKTYQLLE
jgi:hypothetical protein